MFLKNRRHRFSLLYYNRKKCQYLDTEKTQKIKFPAIVFFNSHHQLLLVLARIYRCICLLLKRFFPVVCQLLSDDLE